MSLTPLTWYGMINCERANLLKKGVDTVSRRLAEGKRVRSHMINASEVLTTAVPFNGVLGSYTFQDDVTLIGAELSIEFLVLDAHVNADGQFNANVELTRQAARGQSAGVMACNTEKAWSAAMIVGNSDNRKTERMMFPEGHGLEFDEGETVNLLALCEWLGAGGTLNFYANCRIYYVER